MENNKENQAQQPKKKGWIKTALVVTIVAATGFWLGKRGVKGACEDVKSLGSKAKGMIPGKNNDECACDECEVAADVEQPREQHRENGNGRGGHWDRRPKYNNN